MEVITGVRLEARHKETELVWRCFPTFVADRNYSGIIVRSRAGEVGLLRIYFVLSEKFTFQAHAAHPTNLRDIPDEGTLFLLVWTSRSARN
jgi:hypothetical protein